MAFVPSTREKSNEQDRSWVMPSRDGEDSSIESNLIL